MSEEPQATPEEKPKRPRRTTKTAATKKAKTVAVETAQATPVLAETSVKSDAPAPAAPVESVRVEKPVVAAAPTSSHPSTYWPEPETVTKPQGEGNGKRKRRRRKKKGGAADHGSHADAHGNEYAVEGDDVHQPQQPQASKPPQPQRAALDGQEVADYAWKIFRAELAEEGLDLVDDHDAREITRRSFRLAEIFLEEKTRRTR